MVMQVNEAIDVLARELIADLVANDAGSRWELHPDVGERDWARIVVRATELAGHPAGYAEAYALLARRASGEPCRSDESVHTGSALESSTAGSATPGGCTTLTDSAEDGDGSHDAN